MRDTIGIKNFKFHGEDFLFDPGISHLGHTHSENEREREREREKLPE